MANFGSFLNQFTSNPTILLVLGSALAILLALFGVLYNGLMNRRKVNDGYTAFYVVGGVLVTLAAVAVISWKAAMLALFAFVFSGLPMVIGAMIRSEKVRHADKHRRLRLPYAANGLVKDAFDELTEASRCLAEIVEKRQMTMDEMIRLAARAIVRVGEANKKLAEVQTINK